MNPSVFVLDEPTANLDADAIDTLRQQIIQIKKEGRTVVIAEHRLYFLMDLIDRAIFIQKGKIVQIFSGNEFRNLSDEQRIRMGLRSLVHPVLELPPADPSGAQEGLSVENLSCAFDKQPVFSGLGFSAKRGEVLGIVGHNGAGKTTMTRCLCGLLKEVNGTVRLDGQTLKAKQRNKASFCVMQDVNHQLFQTAYGTNVNWRSRIVRRSGLKKFSGLLICWISKTAIRWPCQEVRNSALRWQPLFSPTRMYLSLMSRPVAWTITVCWK